RRKAGRANTNTSTSKMQLLTCMECWKLPSGQLGQHSPAVHSTLAATVDGQQWMWETDHKTMAQVLSPGSNAPDFTLSVTPDQKLSLKELRGKPVVLFFYPADWSPVCGDQTALYNEVLPEFQKYGAELVGVSVDSAWCHAAFARHQRLHYPLLSDFEPK